jgi:(p)ppGpp synthase/HD superfamily hydrolase
MSRALAPADPSFAKFAFRSDFFRSLFSPGKTLRDNEYRGNMTAENKITNDETAALHLSSRFTSAMDYARHIHIERRKGTGIPYMAHLLGVASLVMGEAGHAAFPVTEDMVIAALLHDAAEDHGGMLRLRDIEHNFGANVARMVEGLSDSLTEDPANKQSWLERKQAYVQRLRQEPADVQLISVADKLYNARAILEDYREIGPTVWERFKRGRNDQISYFDQLLAVYKSSAASRIVDELERVVNELRQVSAREM